MLKEKANMTKVASFVHILKFCKKLDKKKTSWPHLHMKCKIVKYISRE